MYFQIVNLCKPNEPQSSISSCISKPFANLTRGVNDNDNDNEIDLFRHHNGNNTNIKVIFYPSITFNQ